MTKQLKNRKKSINFINLCASALRRSFSISTVAKDIKNKAIIKNQKGIRGGKIIKCFYCDIALPFYKAEVEHIECVIPVFSAIKFMNVISIFKRTFEPDIEPVVVCQKCHKIKTSEELKMRVWWRRQPRYIVYQTICNINQCIYTGVYEFKKFDDNYLGSGKKLSHAIKKYGRNQFKMEVLQVFHIKKQAYKYATTVVPIKIINE